MTTYRLARAASLAVVTLLALGCSKDKIGPDDDDPDSPNHPQNPNALGLAVGVRFDPATFASTGEFALELVPSTKDGTVLVSEQWTITNTLDAPSGASVSLLSQSVVAPDPRNFAVAIDLDASSSMKSADPDLDRAAASQLLWNTLLDQKPTNLAALMDFSAAGATAGFTHTRLLQGWTSDRNALAAQLGNIAAQNVAGSPMYRSAIEVVRWVDTTTDAATTKRILVLLTDGEPNDRNQRDLLVTEALRTDTRLYTVGIAQASDRDERTDPDAVAGLQDLANATGGIYAGAATNDRMSSVLESFARSTASGNLVARFKLGAAPASGTRISGIVRLENDRGVASAPWSFVAP